MLRHQREDRFACAVEAVSLSLAVGGGSGGMLTLKSRINRRRAAVDMMAGDDTRRQWDNVRDANVERGKLSKQICAECPVIACDGLR